MHTLHRQYNSMWIYLAFIVCQLHILLQPIEFDFRFCPAFIHRSSRQRASRTISFVATGNVAIFSLVCTRHACGTHIYTTTPNLLPSCGYCCWRLLYCMAWCDYSFTNREAGSVNAVAHWSISRHIHWWFVACITMVIAVSRGVCVCTCHASTTFTRMCEWFLRI